MCAKCSRIIIIRNFYSPTTSKSEDFYNVLFFLLVLKTVAENLPETLSRVETTLTLSRVSWTESLVANEGLLVSVLLVADLFTS